MRKHIIPLISAAWLACSLAAHAAETCAPVPAGWSAEARAVAGDLCADVLLKSGEDGERLLRVFEAGKPAFSSADAVGCKTCGGTLGDPFHGIAWKNEVLAVSDASGSSQATDETWKFAKRGGHWAIIGWERAITDRLTQSSWRESVNALTGKATAEYLPGQGACQDEGAQCQAGHKPQAKKLACAHPAKLPDPATFNQWQSQAFACGLKTP